MRSKDSAHSANERRRHARLSQAIVALRGDMTQRELGIAIAEVQGLAEPWPQTTISRWEKTTTPPTTDIVYDIEMALGAPHGTLLVQSEYVDIAALDGKRGTEKGRIENAIRNATKTLSPNQQNLLLLMLPGMYAESQREFKADENRREKKRRPPESED